MRCLALAVLLVALGAAEARATFAGTPGLIAYENEFSIWTVRPDGSEQKRIVPAYALNPAWSPEGERLAFNSIREGLNVFVTDADGSNTTLLAESAESPDWSPDGRRLAFGNRQEPFGIGIVNRDGTGRTALHTTPPELAIDTDPVWSPDGERIAFVRKQSRMRCEYDYCVISEESASVHMINADGTGERLVVPDAHQPDWRPDGERLLFSRFQRPVPGTVRPDGTDIRELPLAGHDASWSPDGTRIVYTDTALGHLQTARIDGSERIPAGASPGWNATWQPLPDPSVLTRIGRIRLTGRGDGRARGRMTFFASRSGEVAFNIQARGLERLGDRAAHGVWLTGGGPARFLGYAPPVGRDGRLATSGPRETDAKRFPGWVARARRVLVTKETSPKPRRPGRVVLRGCIARPDGCR